MNTYSEWAEAFTIFGKYNPEVAQVQPGHDIIYAGGKPELVSKNDKVRLEELGWHADEHYECFYYLT